MTSGLDEKVEFFRTPALPGVDLMCVEQSAKLWRVYHETYVVCSGEGPDVSYGEATCRRKRLDLRMPGLTMFEPGDMHVMHRISNPVDFQVLLMPPSVFLGAVEEFDLRSPRPHLRDVVTYDRQLFQAFWRLRSCLQHGSATLEQQSRFVACLRLLLERHAESPPPVLPSSGRRAAARRARDLIHDRLADDISLQDLADVAGLSRFQMLRAFAREFSLPPHAYQTTVRVSRAHSLLQAGVPISDVASQTGFADQSHLTRRFKGILGITPGAYLRGPKLSSIPKP